MGKKVIFIFPIITLIIIGCDKGQWFDSTGTLTTEIRDVGDISRIELYDNVNVIFTSSIDSGTIKIITGKKIIGDIKTEFDNNTLIIKNKNRYNWTRDLDPDINVYVSNKNIREITYESVGKISAETALSGDELDLYVKYGNGSIEMELFYNKVKVDNLAGGSVDVTLSGACDMLYVYHSNNAPLRCENLYAQKVKVTEAGIQNCYIFAHQQLEAYITSYGNIYYSGEPEIIKHSNTGKGKLIHQNK